MISVFYTIIGGLYLLYFVGNCVILHVYKWDAAVIAVCFLIMAGVTAHHRR